MHEVISTEDTCYDNHISKNPKIEINTYLLTFHVDNICILNR